MDNIVLITGASRGIGAATAVMAAARGYTVCINFLKDEVAASAVVAGIHQQGGRAFAFQADISKERQVVEMFSLIDQNVGRISALVNNAGMIISQQKLVDMTGERLQQVFAINVFGSFFCAKEAIKRMSVKHGGQGGSIVNVSSLAAKYGSPFEYIDYAATKGAIDTMTVGLAKELADDQIRVNAVRPGLIHTDIHASAGEPGRIERVKTRIPMQRGGYPDEIAAAILWLLSDEASYMTGALLDVGGGL
ncbi:MAG: SDR family oxidoreductase [Saprospiraceae bacterium]|nr:SDR family oxidoreductase [Saprospiraceae bacterium]